VLGLALPLALAACSGEPAFLRTAHKEELIDGIQQMLLASVEAEKSAVLSTSDEESLQMAEQARELAKEVDRLRDQLRALIVEDGRPVELEGLDAFDRSWKELKAVDERLLVLAVANTNLKAARLSAREGLAAVDRFVGAIDAMERASTDPALVRKLASASVAALREQALLLIHIPIAEDAEMTRLEEQMAALGASVERTLAELRAGAVVSPEALATAAKAWAEHRQVAAEVVRLSRENTNVRSYDVSAHEKRKVTKECLDALAALLAAVESVPQPAR